MSTLGLPEKRHYTHLQRAYRVFERMGAQLLGARTLAALMQVEIETAYNYIKRLRAAGCIAVRGGTGKVPLYGLVVNDQGEVIAKMPPDDGRGRPPRAIVSGEVGSSLELDLEPAAMLCESGCRS
jgi:hypothetical protein